MYNTILNIVTMQSKVSINPKIEKHPGCVAEAVSIMGNKWTALLIMELANGSSRFCALENRLEGISPRTFRRGWTNLKKNLSLLRKSMPRYRRVWSIRLQRREKT